MFQVALLAKAAPLLKRANSLIARWRALPAAQRQAASAQAKEVLALAGPLAAAIRHRGEPRGPSSWKEALAFVHSPEPELRMAEAIVECLREEAMQTPGELADAVGAAGPDDSAFKSAMKIAAADGFIVRSGVSLRGIKWDVTEWADGELLDTDHVRAIEEALLEAVSEHGLASDDRLATSVGSETDAPEFQAALERAIFTGKLKWYGRGVFGLEPDTIPKEPPDDPFAAEAAAGGGADLDEVLAILKSKVSDLSAALKSAAPSPGAAIVDDGDQLDAASRLPEVKQLRDDGILSEEDYAAKKAELLAQL